MAGDALKVIDCEHCGEHTAQIKKRGNSKLMYLHCINPDCRDVNQSSAPGFQAKLQKHLDGEQVPETENKPAKTELEPWKPTKATQTKAGAELLAKQAAENNTENTENKPSAAVMVLGFGIAILAAYAGIKTGIKQ